MNPSRIPVWCWVAILITPYINCVAGNAIPPLLRSRNAVIEFTFNDVKVLRAGAAAWDVASTNAAQLNPGDRIRTGSNSRCGLRLPGYQSVVVLDANGEFLVPSERADSSVFELISRRLFNVHRGPPDEQRFKSKSVAGVVRGTDFALFVETNGETRVAMLSGEVLLTNEFGALSIRDGEMGVVVPGRAPMRVPLARVSQAIQWCLYYPGVLDVTEVTFPADVEERTRTAKDAYMKGDILTARHALPAGWQQGKAAEKIFGAAVVLSAGEVDEVLPLLANWQTNQAFLSAGEQRLVRALEQMVALSKGEQSPLPRVEAESTNQLATELLVSSYAAQVSGKFEEALMLARAATGRNSNFGFAWIRVAELEFGFGRVQRAKEAVNTGLILSPQNAQGVALGGFVCAAENRIDAALQEFDRALSLDGRLANAWLGRGLCRIRTGQVKAGVDDLQMAVTVEPQRALLRSYFAKGLSDARSANLAKKEIELAQRLDPHDPTTWLYSGLIKHRHNDVNAAIRDVERSKELNGNRRLFRSRLLLDQDQAVRSANLAAIYRDAGLRDVSVREASEAVDLDYGNYSAHLFLAESYDSLRDARQVNLRYESPWFNQLLLANLLAPIGAGTLSQNVSQQEYSKLFQRDGLGVSSVTEYSSRGDWREAGSMFGTYGGTSFSIDSYYTALNGQRANDDLEQRTFYGKLKQQITPQDTAFFQVIQYENRSGDVRQHFDPAMASRTLRFEERQDPNFYLGWHHEWAPGSHTLFLGARLEDEVGLKDQNASFPAFSKDADGTLSFGAALPEFGEWYRSHFAAYSAELQQIWQGENLGLIGGVRAQIGNVDADAAASYDPQNFPPEFFGTPIRAESFRLYHASSDLDRSGAYLYSTWRICDPLQLIAGVSYDYVTFPRNVDLPPAANGERHRNQWSPKAGVRWNVTSRTRARAAYTRSLGGSYYDSSVRLEPSEVAGFNQAFRSIIPESVAGTLPGSRNETWSLGFDHKFTGNTFMGMSLENLGAEGDRFRGAFNFFPPAKAAQYRESLDYVERALTLDVTQLIGEQFVVGGRYRWLHSQLEDDFPEVPANIPTDGTFLSRQDVEATLHELNLNLLWNHASGLFGGFQAAYFAQESDGYFTPLADTHFWQFNLTAGYRFLQRRAEVRLGLLNLTDEDYRLNPLNLHAELPRKRTLVARLSFVF